jgi:hypothetical protein
MWSMWNAPSDRDYYDPFGWDEAEEQDDPDCCGHCGARSDQACEEWCYRNASASEFTSSEETVPERTGVRVHQIQSHQFSGTYRPYPSARHCYEFMHEPDGLRQLSALQNGRPPEMFRLVCIVRPADYMQVECYCEDCGLMTGHYPSRVYVRRSTVCSDCSWKRYFSRKQRRDDSSCDGALGPVSPRLSASAGLRLHPMVGKGGQCNVPDDMSVDTQRSFLKYRHIAPIARS